MEGAAQFFRAKTKDKNPACHVLRASQLKGHLTNTAQKADCGVEWALRRKHMGHLFKMQDSQKNEQHPNLYFPVTGEQKHAPVTNL